MIRAATLNDIPDLARIHVQAWHETYPGLLPQAEIDKRDIPYRERLWSKLLADTRLRIAYAPGIGFAQMGVQRDTEFAQQGYNEELWSLYVLSAAQGQGYGRALVRAVAGQTAFTALMVAGNARADRFYRACGATHLVRREVQEDGLTFLEDGYGWTPPFAL